MAIEMSSKFLDIQFCTLKNKIIGIVFVIVLFFYNINNKKI